MDINLNIDFPRSNEIVNLLQKLFKQGETLMASFQEVVDELVQVKAGIITLKDLIANLPPAGVITQAQLDALDTQVDDILATMGAGTVPPVDPNA